MNKINEVKTIKNMFILRYRCYVQSKEPDANKGMHINRCLYFSQRSQARKSKINRHTRSLAMKIDQFSERDVLGTGDFIQKEINKLGGTQRK